MRAGTDKTLDRLVQVFGSARPHFAYAFTNKRSNRIEILVHDGLGLWLFARRLNRRKFHNVGYDDSGTSTMSPLLPKSAS